MLNRRVRILQSFRRDLCGCCCVRRPTKCTVLMNFYTRVLAKFSAAKGMKLTVKVEIVPDGGVSKQKIEETQKALDELGLQRELDFKE